MTISDEAPEFDEPEPDELDDDEDEGERPQVDADLIAEPPHPVNWNLLTAEEAEAEWAELDRWVTWLRHTFGLPASVLPPFWHRHPELVWELSALHIHWLCAYDPEQNGAAPSGWHRDFADTRSRLRDWVAASGTRLDRDRPTRQTTWPGEDPAPAIEDIVIADREQDFRAFVQADVARRQEAEDAFFAALAAGDHDERDR